jgi:hypothetical protein
LLKNYHGWRQKARTLLSGVFSSILIFNCMELHRISFCIVDSRHVSSIIASSYGFAFRLMGSHRISDLRMARCVMWAYIGRADAHTTPSLLAALDGKTAAGQSSRLGRLIVDLPYILLWTPSSAEQPFPAHWPLPLRTIVSMIALPKAAPE